MNNRDNDPFPMLDVPLDMGYKVLRKLSVLDLYNLSHVSDKAKSFVKGYVQYKYKNIRLKIQACRDAEFVISLVNPEGQGMHIGFDSCYFEPNAELNVGEFSVETKSYLLADRWIVWILRRLVSWNKDRAMKLLITHLSEVFTKDGCIQISSKSEKQDKVLMDLIEKAQLKVHCFESDCKYDVSKIKELTTRFPRLLVQGEHLSTRQMKSVFEEWLLTGKTEYFAIRELPVTFNMNFVMRGYEEPTVDRPDREYSVRKEDGTRVPGRFCSVRSINEVDWRAPFILRHFSIKLQPGQLYSTCFSEL